MLIHCTIHNFKREKLDLETEAQVLFQFWMQKYFNLSIAHPFEEILSFLNSIHFSVREGWK